MRRKRLAWRIRKKTSSDEPMENILKIMMKGVMAKTNEKLRMHNINPFLHERDISRFRC